MTVLYFWNYSFKNVCSFSNYNRNIGNPSHVVNNVKIIVFNWIVALEDIYFYFYIV